MLIKSRFEQVCLQAGFKSREETNVSFIGRKGVLQLKALLAVVKSRIFYIYTMKG